MTERGISLLVDHLDLPLHQVNNNTSFVRYQGVLVLVLTSRLRRRGEVLVYNINCKWSSLSYTQRFNVIFLIDAWFSKIIYQ